MLARLRGPAISSHQRLRTTQGVFSLRRGGLLRGYAGLIAGVPLTFSVGGNPSHPGTGGNAFPIVKPPEAMRLTIKEPPSGTKSIKIERDPSTPATDKEQTPAPSSEAAPATEAPALKPTVQPPTAAAPSVEPEPPAATQAAEMGAAPRATAPPGDPSGVARGGSALKLQKMHLAVHQLA